MLCREIVTTGANNFKICTLTLMLLTSVHRVL